MSYNRRYSFVVNIPYSGTAHYSGSVSYPASQSGGTTGYSGSVHYSGTASKNVEVIIEVDTTAFDSSVSNCKAYIYGTATAIAAMDAATCLAIKNNADKVSDAITSGFYNLVSSDISTQLKEHLTKAESLYGKIEALSKRLIDLKGTMEEDYNLLTSRYAKIFTNLDETLERRIKAEMSSAISVVEGNSTLEARTTSTNSAASTTSVGTELLSLKSEIENSNIKSNAYTALLQAKSYINSAYSIDHSISTLLENRDTESNYYVPVMYVNTQTDKENTNTAVYGTLGKDKVQRSFESKNQKWEVKKEDDLSDTIFSQMVAEAELDEQVKEMMKKLKSESETKVNH